VRYEPTDEQGVSWSRIAELLLEPTLNVATIEVCGNKLLQHGCHSEEAVTTMKDTQLSRLLTNIGRSVADFDSCKCPAIKAHINRMRAREGLGVDESCPSESAVVREEYYRAMEHFWHHMQNSYWEFEDVVSEFMNLDFGFIGGTIVATGIVLAKHFVFALF